MYLTSQLIKNVEKVRRLAFPEFDQIILEPKAIQVLANLFLNPDCRSDIDLAKFIGPKPVKLSQISPHIITAAPSTLAKYAQDHQQLNITEQDILKCFALDHAEAIQANQLDIKFSPTYGLSHLLNISQVVKIKEIQRKKFVDLEKKFNNQKIFFKNILVPNNLEILKGQKVFHHFGVVVTIVDTPSLTKIANQIKKQQKENCFIYKKNQVTSLKKSIVDSKDKILFHENLMEKILVGCKRTRSPRLNLKNLSQGKITFTK